MSSIKIFITLLFCSSLLFAEEAWKVSLVKSAREARVKAYAPYSNYFVGAAILTEGGKTFTGTNVENASYGVTICAERCALFHAVSLGERKFKAIAVVTKDGGYPCGACRQALNEFSPNMIVLISDEKGTFIKEMPLSSLLPEAFGPQNVASVK